MIDEELDAARWMQLLDEVREELGEGKIGGIALERRLEFSSSQGVWDLCLVGGRLGYSTQYRFFGSKRFAAAFHLGPARDLEATASWVKRSTGDAAFDAQCTIWTAMPHAVTRIMSDPVRRSIEELWTFHPALSLTVYPESAIILIPGVLLDRAGIIDLLLAAGACIEELLKVRPKEEEGT